MRSQSLCRSCDTAIVWATTRTGRAQPFDAEPTIEGNVLIQHAFGALRAVVLTGAELDAARGLFETDRNLFMPHHATCTHAASHRPARSAS